MTKNTAYKREVPAPYYYCKRKERFRTNRQSRRQIKKNEKFKECMILWPTNSHNFDRKSDGVHEHWTEMTADPNWKEYE